MQKEPHNRISVAQVLLAAAGWACLGTFVLMLPRTISPLAISAARGLSIVIAFFVLNYSSNRSIIFSLRVIAAGVAYGFSAVTYIASLRSLPVAVAAPLHYTSPAFLILAMLASRKRTITKWELAGFTCCVGGAAVLIEPRDTMSASGVCLALASAVCWALYLGMQDTCTAEERSSASFFGGVTLMVLGVCDVGRDCFEMHSLVIFVLLGICSSVLPLLLLARANKGLPATSIALLLLAEPVFATMGAYLIIGQAPSARSVIGLMVVLCGAASGTAALTPPLASTRARVGK